MEDGHNRVSAGKLDNPLAKCVSCAPLMAALLQDNSLPLTNKVIPLTQGRRSWLQTLQGDITRAFICTRERLVSPQNKSSNWSPTRWGNTAETINPHASGHKVISNGDRKKLLP